MRQIELMITSKGVYDYDVHPTTTLQDLINDQGLVGYDFTVDGRPITSSEYGTTSLWDVREVWAAQGVKGA